MDKIQCPIAIHAHKTPHLFALITDSESYTYLSLHRIIENLTTHLKHQQITSGMKIAFVAHPSVMTIALFFALFRLKAVACPISFRLPSCQIQELLQQLDTTHLLCVNTLPLCDHAITPTESDWDPHVIATCVQTTGSIAHPKIACHSMHNHISSALPAIQALELTSSSRYLLSLPLFHISGVSILFRSMFARCPIVISQHPLHLSINIHKITHTSLVPTQLHRLLQDPHWSPTHLSCALIGGASLDRSLCQRALLRHIPLIITYGMTEMSSMIACGKPQLNSPMSYFALAHRKIIQDATGQLLVRGETLFKGYWNCATHTCHLPLQDGWFATGDLGKQQEDGSWILTGRKDRMFISGGENIQPEEIEEALCQLPGILAAKVVPHSDPEFGQRPVAYLLEERPKYDLTTICQLLKATLPSFKHPIALFSFTPEMVEQMKSTKFAKNQEEALPAPSCDPH